jgi:hypothetical protein
VCVVEKGLSLALGCRSSAKKKKREQNKNNPTKSLNRPAFLSLLFKRNIFFLLIKKSY